MTNADIDILLSEINKDNGFTNLCQSDVKYLTNEVDVVDAIKITEISPIEVGKVISKTIEALREKNSNKIISKILFAIKTTESCKLNAVHVSDIHEMLDLLDEDIQCIWGISTNNNLIGGSLEIIVAIGFKNIV